MAVVLDHTNFVSHANAQSRSQMRVILRLALAAVAGARSWPRRVVELIWSAKTANAAHSRAALLERKKSAIGSAAAVAGIEGAPRIRVVRQIIRVRGLRRNCRGECKRRDCKNYRSHHHVSTISHCSPHPITPVRAV